MRPVKRAVFLSVLLCAPLVQADPIPPTWDEDRLAGFAEHKSSEKVFDREREKGRNAFLEELEQWERSRQAAIKEYKQRVKSQSPQENGPEHKEDQKARARVQENAEAVRRDYVQEKQKVAQRRRQKSGVTAEEELGLTEHRPRYDIAKRTLFGAPGSVRPRSSSPSYGGGPDLPPPPPPSFGHGSPGGDDFGGGMDYIPPPPPPMPEYDDVPPPPMPMAPFEGGDFPPPPPIPDFGDFPPPMAPPPDGF